MEKHGINPTADSAQLTYVSRGKVTRITIPRGHLIEIDTSVSSEVELADTPPAPLVRNGAPRMKIVFLVTPLADARPIMVTGNGPAVSGDLLTDLAVPEIEPEKMMDLLEAAWAVIANSGVFLNPKEPSPGCREAAERWRDQYHRTLTAWCKRRAAGGPGSSD
jgi:hypothetical protein